MLWPGCHARWIRGNGKDDKKPLYSIPIPKNILPVCELPVEDLFQIFGGVLGFFRCMAQADEFSAKAHLEVRLSLAEVNRRSRACSPKSQEASLSSPKLSSIHTDALFVLSTALTAVRRFPDPSSSPSHTHPCSLQDLSRSRNLLPAR